MPSALPIIFLGGAALVILGGKKKRAAGPRDIPLDKPVQVKKDGLTVNSGRSPVPPAVKEAPLEPFDSVQQVQEGLIATGKKLKRGADGKWGPESQRALDQFSTEKGFKNEAKAHLATPDSLQSLHSAAYHATKAGALANVNTSIGTLLWCDITKLRCPTGYECVALFGPGQAPAGYEDLGMCIPVAMINAGYMPGPQDYAPGGFDEIVFSPDYESVAIGGGWKFQTLEPWLYNRMREGKLLTYALEGSLFWEDLITTSPKEFWNSTLASIGLAPATAGVGTKAWLDYRKAFRSEIPITETVMRVREETTQIWKGPKNFVPGPGYSSLSLTWPPPNDIVEKYAGWRGDKMTGDLVVLREPDGIHKGKLQPYGARGETHWGAPQTMEIKRLPKGSAPAGKELFEVIGGSGGRQGPRFVTATSMDDAVRQAKKLDGGIRERARRMMFLWGDQRTVIKTVGETVKTGRVSIQWAKPSLRQAGKNVGIPLAIGATIAAAVYGSSQLSRVIGDRQRDLIAESAVLAWKKFAQSHKVRIGNKKIRIDNLKESIAVQFFQSFVAKQIVRFQMSTYE